MTHTKTPDFIAPIKGPDRLVALDVFRGLVIVAMTIVNFLSPVQGVPAWAKHRPGNLEGYTFVDVIFPAFLFMVGVAIPFALQRRLERGDSSFALGGKIVFRSTVLLFLGVLTVNPMFYSDEWSVLPKDWWFGLTYFFAIVALISVPPKVTGAEKRNYHLAKWIGFAGLLILLSLFRGRSFAGDMVWIRHSWWGMLGQIGWAYLTACLLWLLLRKYTVALFCMMWFLLAFYIAERHGGLKWIGPSIRSWLNIGPLFGTNPATVLTGVLAGTCLQRTSVSPIKRFGALIAFGMSLYVIGELVRPLHGINKSDHTESYALVTGGISCLVFAVVYFAVDIKKWNYAQSLLGPIGQNALIAYLVPDIIGKVTSVTAAFIWSVLVLDLVWILTRYRIVVRL